MCTVTHATENVDLHFLLTITHFRKRASTTFVTSSSTTLVPPACHRSLISFKLQPNPPDNPWAIIIIFFITVTATSSGNSRHRFTETVTRDCQFWIVRDNRSKVRWSRSGGRRAASGRSPGAPRTARYDQMGARTGHAGPSYPLSDQPEWSLFGRYLSLFGHFWHILVKS